MRLSKNRIKNILRNKNKIQSRKKIKKNKKYKRKYNNVSFKKKVKNIRISTIKQYKKQKKYKNKQKNKNKRKNKNSNKKNIPKNKKRKNYIKYYVGGGDSPPTLNILSQIATNNTDCKSFIEKVKQTKCFGMLFKRELKTKFISNAELVKQFYSKEGNQKTKDNELLDEYNKKQAQKEALRRAEEMAFEGEKKAIVATITDENGNAVTLTSQPKVNSSFKYIQEGLAGLINL